MTVRYKILAACLMFNALCLGVGLSAWQSQQRLSGLAISLYDHAFVAQDFLGRASSLYAGAVTRSGAVSVRAAERQEALHDILVNLDIAAASVQTTKTRAAIEHLRGEVAALLTFAGDRTGTTVARINDDFAKVAHRLSNYGLAQRDDAEASARRTRQLLVATLGGALAGVAATGWLLTHSVVPPLRRAALDMMRLCQGDVEGHVSGTARADEIGDFCRSMGVFRQALLDNRMHNVRFKAALDNMTQGLCLFDSDESLVVYNPRFAAMFGTPVAGTKACVFLSDPRVGNLFGPPDADTDDSADEHVHELPDGRVIQVSRQIIPGAGWVATCEDVTERCRWQDQLSHMARHDALTGLPNRVVFRERIDQVLLLSRQLGDTAVFYLDLDGFKNINDTLGHPAGDELLQAVAARLRECIRTTDLVVRLGGDEFAIIQTDVEQYSQTTGLSERVLAALGEPFNIQGHHVTIGTSIGVALVDQAATADGLLRRADIALYQAKADGRGTWRLFEPSMDTRLQLAFAE